MNPLHKRASWLCGILVIASTGCSAASEPGDAVIPDERERLENSAFLMAINGVEGDCQNGELWQQVRLRVDGVELYSMGFIEPGERHVELDYMHFNCARSFYEQNHTFERGHRYLVLIGGRGDLFDEKVHFEDITSNYSSLTDKTKLLVTNVSTSTPLADFTIQPAAGETPHEPRKATIETMGRTWIEISPDTAYDVSALDQAMNNGPWAYSLTNDFGVNLYYTPYCRLAARKETYHPELECVAAGVILE